MKRVKIDCNKIKDWDSFHDIFAKEFGFPDFYGRNMDAWKDWDSDVPGESFGYILGEWGKNGNKKDRKERYFVIVLLLHFGK